MYTLMKWEKNHLKSRPKNTVAIRLACYHYMYSLATCFSTNYFSSSWHFKSVALMLYLNRAALLSGTPCLGLHFANGDTKCTRITRNPPNQVANFTSWQHCPFVVSVPCSPTFCFHIVSVAFPAVLKARKAKSPANLAQFLFAETPLLNASR